MLFNRFMRRTIVRICIFQVIFLEIISSSVFAGQNIELNGQYFGNVYGNSSDADYSTYDLDTFDNQIRVNQYTNMNNNSIYGSYFQNPTGEAEIYNNRVDVYGGINLGSLFAGYISRAKEHRVHHNTLNIVAGEFSDIDMTIGGGFTDSKNDGVVSTVQDANYNVINIEDGTFANNTLLIYGAYSRGDDNDSAGGGQNIIGNVVNIRSGTFKSSSFISYSMTIYGGYGSNILGAQYVSNNEVNITGGTFSNEADTHNMSIYGGFSDYASPNVGVSGNIINITGGTFGGKNMIICGGAVTGGAAINNTVTIGGSAIFTTDNITLCGGVNTTDPSGSSPDVLAGNTLNMKIRMTLVELKNFENYYFYIPSDMSDNGTMITLNSSVAMPSNTGNTNVQVSAMPGNKNLRPGDRVILIDDVGLNGIADMLQNYNRTSSGEGMQTPALQYVFDLELTDFQLIATFNRIKINPWAKSLANGMLSSATVINQGADVVSNHLASYSDLDFSSAYGLKFFNNSSSGGSILHIGSYRDMPVSQNNKIESDSLTQITGGSYSRYGGRGLTSIGAFHESGAISYESRDMYNDFPSLAGSGTTTYQGVGTFIRRELGGAGNSRFYIEAAGRMGEMASDFTTDWVDVNSGRYMGYSISPIYYGVQGGAGYIWKEKSGKGNIGFELSAKYLQTTIQGESVALPSGEQLEFDDLNSRRLQAGTRFSYLPKKWIHTYLGAAYEYELDGDAGSKIDDYANTSPDIKGNTVIGECGVVLGRVPVRFGLSLKGSAGKRENVSTNTELTFDF